LSEFGTGMLCLLKKKKNKKNKKLDKIKMSKSSFRKKVLKTCFWFSAEPSIFIEKRRRDAFGRPFLSLKRDSWQSRPGSRKRGFRAPHLLVFLRKKEYSVTPPFSAPNLLPGQSGVLTPSAAPSAR
jgi:hypothetical protein